MLYREWSGAGCHGGVEYFQSVPVCCRVQAWASEGGGGASSRKKNMSFF